MKKVRDWEANRANWKIICQRCGKVGTIDNDKTNVSWYLHWYTMEFVGRDDIEVEYHLCSHCEQEVFPDRL